MTQAEANSAFNKCRKAIGLGNILLPGIFRFAGKQIDSVVSGGWPVLRWKIGMLLAIPWAIPAVVVVRLLRPLVLIRFGPLVSNRIGHFTLNVEIYLCQRDLGMHRRRTVDITYNLPRVCNQYLKKQWDQKLNVRDWAKYLDRANGILPGGGKHLWPIPHYVLDDGLLSRTPAHLSFTPDEEQRGRQALKDMGVPADAPFVCFHNRDSSYLDNVTGKPGLHSSNDYRDCHIGNYLQAAEELTLRGYYTVRTGSVVNEPLDTANTMIIDYATLARTDFMDIYLGAKCSFFLGCNSGIIWVPKIFRRPVACANWVPLADRITLLFGGRDTLTTPKKLWLREECRFMTFREVLESGAGAFRNSQQYEQMGVDVVENTPEEIAALAVEMDQRLKGTWENAEEAEALQEQFWSPFKEKWPELDVGARIGTEFLRQNRELLG